MHKCTPVLHVANERQQELPTLYAWVPLFLLKVNSFLWHMQTTCMQHVHTAAGTRTRARLRLSQPLSLTITDK